MAKIFGSVSRNEGKNPNNKQPDLKGSIKIGGFKGENAEARNREAAEFLRNVAQEFADKKETYISLALWKRVDKETGDQFLSLVIQDNSWRKENTNETSQQQQETPAATKNTDDDLVF